MSTITSINALQILDSRGVPTLRVYVQTSSGIIGEASVPSGASTGVYEALELRDADPAVYFGKGVQKALGHVEGPIAACLKGVAVANQAEIDRRMIEGDGSSTKSNWGANAMLGVSMASARAAALEAKLPLYRYIRQKMTLSTDDWILPCPMLNIINGGAHADNTIDAQEFMIFPVGATSFGEALRWACEVYGHLKKLLKSKNLATGVGDEGGFAPALERDEDALSLIVEAIKGAGYKPGKEISIALDPAASEFYEEGLYCDKKKIARSMAGTKRTSEEQINLLEQWIDRYPIASIEDGLAESDWEGFQQLTARLGSRCQIVGDDLLVTNPLFVKRAIENRSVNSVLIKLNQIGTLSETLRTIEMAHAAGFKTVISHRSGETEDTFIADLVVACQSGQIKTGAPCRSERVAKYNRLLEIEKELGAKARYAR